MRARWIRGLATATVAAIAIAGCSDDDDPVVEATTTIPIDDGTTSTVPDNPPEDGDALPDGEHFGYLVELTATAGAYAGTFDLAYLYTGNEAITEAAEDGEVLETEFYIRNENPRLRDIELAPSARVRAIDPDACCEPKDVTPAEFVRARGERGAERTTVHLTVQDGRVTEIEEQYFP